jgi:hypothetical protein
MSKYFVREVYRVARFSLVFLLTVFAIQSGYSSVAFNVKRETIQIGQINYFGYAGLNLKKVQKNLPIHIGDSVSYERFDRDETQIQQVVQEITGKPATDIAEVCCDKAKHLLVYIGLSGRSSHPVVISSAPHGSDHLESTALSLYEQTMAAIENAVRHGSAKEDDSRGYALFDDPATRKIQLAMRAYAANRGPELERVLRNSADVQQRRVSAWLLGYADRSPAQIQCLAEAATDPDEVVRNNAIRALEVLASAPTSTPIRIDPAPFISLLFSGKWLDRNKASILLAHLSRNRDPVLLGELHAKALQPLIEGARWKDLGHSSAFLAILGRIGGIPEARLDSLIAAGDKTPIIQAALQSHNDSIHSHQ